MATKNITLAITNLDQGSPWTVTFTADDSIPIKNLVEGPNMSSMTLTDITTFNVASVNGYDGSGVQYVTWRTTNPPGQHPSSGVSLDIWSQKFYENIMTYNNGEGMTWDQMLTGSGSNGNEYNLSTEKWSLVYDYSNLNAYVYTKGGTLTVTVV